MFAPADLVAGETDQGEYRADHQHDDADNPDDVDGGDEPDDEQDDAEHDHFVHTTFGRKVARTERPDQRAYVVPVKQTVLTRHRLRSRMA